MIGIKNILFDLGGVILHLNRQAAIDAFVDLGFKDVETVLRDFKQSGTFLRFEDGSIDASTFREEIRARIGKKIPDEAIDLAWGKMTTHVDTETLQLLLQLKKHYKTYLLSNTNPIHIDLCAPKFSYEGNDGFEAFFDKCYFSYLLRICKPAPQSFLAVCSDATISPEETLFIDDSTDNLNAADKLGFKTLHVKTPTELNQQLAINGILPDKETR